MKVFEGGERLSEFANLVCFKVYELDFFFKVYVLTGVFILLLFSLKQSFYLRSLSNSLIRSST